MRKYCFLFLFFTASKCFSQNTADIITVGLDVAGRSTECYDPNYKPVYNYHTLLTIINNQDTAIHFYMMTCSWMDSWVCDNDSIQFHYPGCDSNFPIPIELPAKKAIKLYATLRSAGDTLYNKKFRMGFMMLSHKEFWDIHKNEAGLKKTKKIYWSNEDELKPKRSFFTYKQKF